MGWRGSGGGLTDDGETWLVCMCSRALYVGGVYGRRVGEVGEVRGSRECGGAKVVAR